MPNHTALAFGHSGTGNTSPPQVATVRTAKTTTPLNTGTGSSRTKKAQAGTGSSSLLPTDDDEKKSLTVGRYQFRKDGAGWECREIIGKGASRKRPYLSHLSRTKYAKMQADALTSDELEGKLIEWADEQKAQKRNG